MRDTPGSSHPPGTRPEPYHEPVTLSVRDVAAVIRDRKPGTLTWKLRKLLYYCQGHHLATFNRPLFDGTISAWDTGPVVDELLLGAEGEDGRVGAGRGMGEAQLNTIGYVLSRYGALTGQDLENLTRSEEPWQLADSGRRPGGSARIEPEWIRQYFTARGRAELPYPNLDSSAVTAGAEQRLTPSSGTDDTEEIKVRLEGLRARLTSRA